MSAKIKCKSDGGKYAYITAEVFAQSAYDNNVSLESFSASLAAFSASSVSSVPQINEWRQEATDKFFELLEKNGKLNLVPQEFFGGSDYDDGEED